MVAMTVPMPAFLSYFWMKAMISAKKLIMGEIRFVTLSPMRYTACDNSGEYPSNINIGINTGAMIAHFADALPMAILISPDNKINKIMSGISPSPEAITRFAPLMAKMMPRLLHLK